jgi:hypothetical protein
VKTATLCCEMKAAFTAMEQGDIDHLIGLGISEILLTYFQMVGCVRVRQDYSRTLYDADGRGIWSYVTPVCLQYPETPESTRSDVFPLVGNVVDLVAWSDQEPEKWRLRTGAASWLGCIEPQYCSPEPVRIWRSPLSWLRNRCVGLVPLTRDRAEINGLLAVCRGGIVAEDKMHARWLRNIFAHPRPSPQVSCPGLEAYCDAA